MANYCWRWDPSVLIKSNGQHRDWLLPVPWRFAAQPEAWAASEANCLAGELCCTAGGLAVIHQAGMPLSTPVRSRRRSLAEAEALQVVRRQHVLLVARRPAGKCCGGGPTEDMCENFTWTGISAMSHRGLTYCVTAQESGLHKSKARTAQGIEARPGKEESEEAELAAVKKPSWPS